MLISTKQLQSLVQGVMPQVLEIRRHLHQNPELSGQEDKTSQYLQHILHQQGVTLHSHIGGYGFLAKVQAEHDADWVALRADMDALPVQQLSNKAYRSQVQGVSHVCGHDSHSAMLMGATLILQQLRTKLAQHVGCIFQPAEEDATGAKAMLEDDLLAIFQPKRIHAFHVFPYLASGRIGLREGVMCAATDIFDVTITGQGGHAARPHECHDVILVMSHIIQALHHIVSRKVSAQHHAVLSLGHVKSGYAANVMPEKAFFSGTIRSLHPEAHQNILNHMQKIIKQTAIAWDVKATLSMRQRIPLLKNDIDILNFSRQTLQKALPDTELLELTEASMGGEDFSEFLQHIPGCLLRLGTCCDDATGFPLHHPQFDIDEHAMHTGIAALVALALAT